jgi:hypothetical protein
MLLVTVFWLLITGTTAQKTTISVAQPSPDHSAIPSSQGVAKFTDATSVVALNFEYLASHTSRKCALKSVAYPSS